MRKILPFLFIFVLLFTSCTTAETTKTTSIIDDLNAELEAIDQEWETEKAEFYNATISHYFPNMTNDEILEYLGTHKTEIMKDWEITHYVDSFGDPTDEAYARLRTEGRFSNSATKGDTLEVIFLVDDHSFSFKLYEYGSYLVTGDLSADIKDGDTSEQTILDLLNPSDRYQVKRVYQYEEEEDAKYWHDLGMESVKEMMASLGYAYSDYFDVLKMISDGGVIKFSAHDDYSSQYSWECNTDNLAILQCAIWMEAGEIEDMGWYEALI